MARFNLDDYETVEERIKRFYAQYEDGRIITEWANDYGLQEGTGRWVMKALIYLTAGDQANNLPKATGYASEMEQGPQANWAAELAETSAIGRALANMNLSGNRRSSREEMEKVQRTETQPKSFVDYLAKLDELTTKEEIRELYQVVQRAGGPKEILEKIAAKGKTIK